MILPKIIKEELGEDVYNQMSEICLSPEREKIIYTSAENIEAWNKMWEDEFKKYLKLQK